MVERTVVAGCLCAGEHALPTPREIRWDAHQRKINAYADVIAALVDHTDQDTTLHAGEILFLDNYRCLDGVRPHDGPRTVHIGRARSKDAM